MSTLAIVPQNKDDVLRFRVTAQEKRKIEAAAERDHQTVSNWVRTMALRAAGVIK